MVAANEVGIQVLTLTQAGQANGLWDNLDEFDSARESVKAALSGGRIVTTPEHPLTIAGWYGVVWYVESTTEPYTLEHMTFSTSPNAGGETTGFTADGVPAYLGNEFFRTFEAGDGVNAVNGNLYRDETDFSIRNLGFPLMFRRHYDAQLDDDIELGVGWLHSYSDSLFLEGNGDIIWTTGMGERHTFTPNPSGSGFKVPPTLYGTFTQAGLIYTFRQKDGMVYEFDRTSASSATARLNRIVDRYNNGVWLEYDPQTKLLKRVHDTEGRSTAVASARNLEFSYDTTNTRLLSVKDFTRVDPSNPSSPFRTWTFTYAELTDPTTGRVRSYLQQVTSPSDNDTLPVIVRYEYIQGGRLHGLLHRVTEPDGATREFTYYPNRRSFEVIDPEGNVSYRSYNLLSRVTTLVDERHHATDFAYDGDGLLVRRTNPDRTRETWEWKDFLMVSHTEELGREETFEYSTDAMGNVVRLVDRTGVVTSLVYETVTVGTGRNPAPLPGTWRAPPQTLFPSPYVSFR